MKTATVKAPKPGKGGQKYVPYAKRTGLESIVYFTRDLSPDGLIKAFDKIEGALKGKIAVKLHTGEQNGPNIIPRPWVKKLFEEITRPLSRPTPITRATATRRSSTARR